MNPISRLNELLTTENPKPLLTAAEGDIVAFIRNNGLIPEDLIEYFKVVNGTSGKYDERIIADNFSQFVNKCIDDFEDL